MAEITCKTDKIINPSICWTCEHAGKCSWGKEWNPVKGWTATKHGQSYHVYDCPQYEDDRGVDYPIWVSGNKLSGKKGYYICPRCKMGVPYGKEYCLFCASDLLDWSDRAENNAL